MIIQANPNRITNFGVVGENPYNIIEFDISKLLQNTEEQQNIGYLNAGFIYTDTWNIVFEQSGIFSLAKIDTIIVNKEAGILKWKVTNNLTSVEGLNRCQIIYNTTINEKKVLRKSPIYYFSIGQSLIDDVRPPKIDDWISELTEAGDKLTSVLENLNISSEDIEAIQEAVPEAIKINEAADEINRLEENVDASEAWAVGTKDGVPVTQEEAGFKNNSKHWAYEAEKFAQGTQNGEEIAGNTTNAKYFAEEAKKAKENAENFANGANLEADTISAKYFSEQAKKWAIEQKENLAEGSAKYWAEESEKFAQGTLHGEEILGNTTNAKYFANEAEKAKEESEKWAIGAIEDLEDGSSKYWAEQSEKHSDVSKLWAIGAIEENTEGSAQYWARASEEAASSASSSMQTAEEAQGASEKAASSASSSMQAAEEAKRLAVEAQGASEKAAEHSESWAGQASTAADTAVQAKKDLEDAKNAAETARNEAQKWATAEKEVLEAGSSMYWAEEAKKEKELAKSWAIGGTEETEKNSAKYWAGQAKNIATGDITATLDAVIDNHDGEPGAHANQFDPITQDIEEIKKKLVKVGTADTIIASTSTEETLSLKVWKGTKEQYSNIITKDPSTLYIVVPEVPSLI